jgi:uncharacterized protein (TIGR04255 family)
MPTVYPHLPNAPIVEAIVDLRVRPQEQFDVMGLKELHSAIAEDYPTVEEQRLMQGRFQFSEAGLVSAGHGRAIRGFRATGREGRNVVQFRIDGFTFSRLTPYQTWESLFGEAWRLWGMYRRLAQPRAVTRLATRFVNRLTFSEQLRLEDYFVASPDVPDGLPDEFVSFLYRYSLPPVDGVSSNVTLMSEASSPGRHEAAIVFDIDCFVQEDDLVADDDQRIMDHFGNLRDMKNRIFFKSVTQKALERFA